MVSRNDFMLALETDIKPSFGTNEDALDNYMRRGIIIWDPSVQDVLDSGELCTTALKSANADGIFTLLLEGKGCLVDCLIEWVIDGSIDLSIDWLIERLCSASPELSIFLGKVFFRVAHVFIMYLSVFLCLNFISPLVTGPPNAGKTALAAHICKTSGFPFVKICSPVDMVGFTETAKCLAIKKMFDDAYKSELSCLLLDNLDVLMEYTPVGPRFSNTVLQVLQVKTIFNSTQKKIFQFFSSQFSSCFLSFYSDSSKMVKMKCPLFAGDADQWPAQKTQAPGHLHDQSRLDARGGRSVSRVPCGDARQQHLHGQAIGARFAERQQRLFAGRCDSDWAEAARKAFVDRNQAVVEYLFAPWTNWHRSTGEFFPEPPGGEGIRQRPVKLHMSQNRDCFSLFVIPFSYMSRRACLFLKYLLFFKRKGLVFILYRRLSVRLIVHENTGRTVDVHWDVQLGGQNTWHFQPPLVRDQTVFGLSRPLLVAPPGGALSFVPGSICALGWFGIRRLCFCSCPGSVIPLWDGNFVHGNIPHTF